MPTSSQALILRQGTSFSDAQLNRDRYIYYDKRRCPFTPNYELNDRVKHDIATVDIKFGHSVINVPNTDNSKYCNYNSEYSFVTRVDINGHTDHVTWDTIPVDNCPSESSIGSASVLSMSEKSNGESCLVKRGAQSSGSFTVKLPARPKTAKPIHTSQTNPRPYTAIPIQKTSKSVPTLVTIPNQMISPDEPKRPTFSPTIEKPEISPFMTEPLANLGFRKESLCVRKDCVYDSIAQRKLLLHPRKEQGWTSDREFKYTTDVPKFTYTKPSHTNLPSKSSELLLTDSDTASVDLDGFKRVKPTVHMRSDEPEKRPTAAIFSFRENEFSSHAEVKYLIETQIGVKVKTVKFDPLDIRCCKPDVRSRWIVDFHSVPDVDKVIKKGLILGKDKLVFYKHDDVTKRELSTWKFFMKVQEAKKRLKGNPKFRRNKPKSAYAKSAKCTNSVH